MIGLRAWLGWVVAAFLACLVAAHAQSSEPPVDYEAWDAVANRAEAALESGGASTAALDNLRDEIAAWRADFLATESGNQSRINTLLSQLSALGPAPAEGEAEPIEIANRRAELDAQLDRLRAPQLAATEAFNRADGLIGELDQVIRDRQNQRLFELGPSPLNPETWEPGLRLGRDRLQSMAREVQRSWNSPAQMALAREVLPLTGLLTAVGLLLFINGRRWMQRATEMVHRRENPVGRIALGFVVSLGQFILPVLGLIALSQAALSTGLLGFRGTELAMEVPRIGLFVYSALWLRTRVFPPGEGMPGPLDLDEVARAKGRGYCAVLGLTLGVGLLLVTVFDFESGRDAAAIIFVFPVLVLIGIGLFRMGRFLTESARATAQTSPDTGLRLQITRLLGRAFMAVGIVGPVAAAVGYENFSAAIVYPTVLSVALLGLLAILTGPIRDLFAAFTGRTSEEAREALVPVLVTFLITLASVPLFALIWGVRPAELAEIWTRFLAGVTIGETQISPSDFLVVLVVFVLGYGLTRMIQGTLKNTVLPRTRLDVGGRNAIVSGFGYVGIFLAGLAAITAAGINLSSFAIFASALAVGVGFGLQNIVSNFVSGIILLIERPISEGDWVEVGGQMGYVRNISVRSTRIETFDRTDVIVPNADFVSGQVINYTRGNSIGRVIVPVGVAYGTDTRKVEAILQEIAEAHPMVLLNPKPNVIFQGFGADSLDFEIRAILRDVNWVLSVKSDMNHEIAKRFTEEGIEIPFAQRDVWLRNPETLRTPGNEPADQNGDDDT